MLLKSGQVQISYKGINTKTYNVSSAPILESRDNHQPRGIHNVIVIAYEGNLYTEHG